MCYYIFYSRLRLQYADFGNVNVPTITLKMQNFPVHLSQNHWSKYSFNKIMLQYIWY